MKSAIQHNLNSALQDLAIARTLLWVALGTFCLEALAIGIGCGLLSLHFKTEYRTPWILIVPWIVVRVAPLAMSVVRLSETAKAVRQAFRLNAD